MYGIQDIITKGKVGETVNMLHGMIRTVGREMEVKTTKFKEWDYWYDDQHKGKKREGKMTLKENKKRNDEESRSRYCSCKKEYL